MRGALISSNKKVESERVLEMFSAPQMTGGNNQTTNIKVSELGMEGFYRFFFSMYITVFLFLFFFLIYTISEWASPTCFSENKP